MAIFPFILLRNKEDKNDLNLVHHERIHIIQQIEMLVLPFFIWYLTEYAIRLIQYRDQHKAYRNISFEREAYANEHNLNYLKKRKFYNFLKYI
ncbi:hypothetical protein [Empedobacter sp. GD03739]|uniref:hypothetical protein n=1 Tax=Empedobacter sp. GD03739 TaxID=2975376 RepID=UPI00244B376B|nr:hypothetical protein [Empedobacter sp. GD03739]MDH1602102.1 hypothetical protein [Empedobacter sp. GD03739]